MRKIILLTGLVLGTIPVFSQITTLSDAELGFGLDLAMPMSELKNTHKTGFGGSAKFAMTIYNTNLAPTFQAGVLAFNGKPLPEDQTNLLKETYKPILFIPVKAGVRYTFPIGVYAEPQIGTSIALSEDYMGEGNTSAGFTYAFNIGFQTLPGMDISARYESTDLSHTNIAMVGLRVAYHFTFRRQEIY